MAIKSRGDNDDTKNSSKGYSGHARTMPPAKRKTYIATQVRRGEARRGEARLVNIYIYMYVCVRPAPKRPTLNSNALCIPLFSFLFFGRAMDEAAKQIERFRKSPAELLAGEEANSQGPKKRNENKDMKKKEEEQQQQQETVTCWWKSSTTSPAPPAHSRRSAATNKKQPTSSKNSPLSIGGQGQQGKEEDAAERQDVGESGEARGLAASDTKVGR